MNKEAIAKVIRKKIGVYSYVARSCVDETFTLIAESLAKGETVKIKDFGVFEVCTKPEREGRNPKTGERMRIPETRYVKFKPSKDLKEKVR